MPEETKNNSKPWFERKEVWGAGLSAASGILMLFSSNTVAYKIGAGIGIVLGVTGLRAGYKSDNLPSGLSSVMDKIPNAITGVRGENNKLINIQNAENQNESEPKVSGGES